ncbi:hypothetical protein D3C75_1247850 [compost metagenome]
MHVEINAVFVGFPDYCVLDIQVVTVISLVQRSALDMHVTGFELGHDGILRKGENGGPASPPTAFNGS